MRTLWTITLLACAGSHLAAQPGYTPNAALGAPYSRPALSPYLNLLRGGDPAANYFMGVLPEYNARATSLLANYNYQFNLLQSSQGFGAPDLFADEDQLSPTGHPTAFMYYGGAYQIPSVRPYLPYNPNQSRQPMRR